MGGRIKGRGRVEGRWRRDGEGEERERWEAKGWVGRQLGEDRRGGGRWGC